MDVIKRIQTHRKSMIIVLFLMSMVLTACAQSANQPLTADITQPIFFGSDQMELHQKELPGTFTVKIADTIDQETLRLTIQSNGEECSLKGDWKQEAQQLVFSVDLMEPGRYQFRLIWAEGATMHERTSIAFELQEMTDYVTWEIVQKQPQGVHISLQRMQEADVQLHMLDGTNREELALDWQKDHAEVTFQRPGNWTVELTVLTKDGVPLTKHLKHIELTAPLPIISVQAKEVDLITQALPIQAEEVTLELFVQGAFETAKELTVTLNEEERDVVWIKQKDGYRSTFTLQQDGEYEINVCAVDRYHQRTCVRTQPLSIDQTAPVVKLDQHVPAYVPSSITLSYQIEDAHPSKEDIVFEVQRNGTLIDLVPVMKPYENGLQVLLVLEEEGEYEIRLHVQDALQHTARFEDCEVIRFCIDQSVPSISLQRSDDQRFVNHDEQVDIHIKDENLYHSMITVFRNQERIHTFENDESSVQSCHFVLQEDGEYRIEVEALDQAGWKNTLSHEVIIDQTKPVINASLNGIPAQHDKAYSSNQSIDLQLTWKDAHPKQSYIQLWREGVLIHEESQFQATALSIPITPQKEEQVEVRIQVTDQAQNEARMRIPLRMDAYMPDITFVDEPFQGKPRNVIWTPRLRYDQEAFHVVDAMLLRNQRQVKSYQWPNPIEEEGRYMLSLTVRDDAMNEASLVPPFQFVIDHTPPTYRIVEHERQEELLDHRISIDTKLRLYLKDTYSEQVHLQALRLDDREYTENDILWDESGQPYYLLVFDQAKAVKVSFEAKDEADNVLRAEEVFHVSDTLSRTEVKTIPAIAEGQVSDAASDQQLPMLAGFICVALLFGFVVKRYAA